MTWDSEKNYPVDDSIKGTWLCPCLGASIWFALDQGRALKVEGAQQQQPHLRGALPAHEGLEDGEVVEGRPGLSRGEVGRRFEVCMVGGEERRE